MKPTLSGAMNVALVRADHGPTVPRYSGLACQECISPTLSSAWTSCVVVEPPAGTRPDWYTRLPAEL